MLQERTLLTLYYSFVYPYFTYCITVWGNTYPTVLDPLKKCQKRAVRIVHGAGKYDHTDPIFQSLKILNLKKLYMYSVQIFLHKYRQQNLPDIFIDFFTVASTIHEHHTRQNNHYCAPLARCVQRSSTPRCTGVKINNSLFDCISYNFWTSDGLSGWPIYAPRSLSMLRCLTGIFVYIYCYNPAGTGAD